MNPLPVGTRVKHSGHVIQKKRDYWNNCGRQPAKDRAKDALDEAIEQRGTITAILEPTSAGAGAGYEVTWDHGPVSRCLRYLVISAE